jgi:hypothetical protein
MLRDYLITPADWLRRESETVPPSSGTISSNSSIVRVDALLQLLGKRVVFGAQCERRQTRFKRRGLTGCRCGPISPGRSHLCSQPANEDELADFPVEQGKVSVIPLDK